MTPQDIRRLADRLEQGGAPGPEDARRLAALVSAAAPDRTIWSAAGPDDFADTDGVLRLLADLLPSWSVHISGQSAAVAGRWTCTIRETGVRDDDEMIGVGKADTLPHAALAALLRIIAPGRG